MDILNNLDADISCMNENENIEVGEKSTGRFVSLIYWAILISVVACVWEWGSGPYYSKDSCRRFIRRESPWLKDSFSEIGSVYGRYEDSGAKIAAVVFRDYNYNSAPVTIVCYFKGTSKAVSYTSQFSGDVRDTIKITSVSQLWKFVHTFD